MNNILDILDELDNMWDDYLVYYPKKYYELVIRIKKEFLNLYKYIRLKDKTKLNVSICMLDLFLEISYEKRILSESKCIDLGSKLYLVNYKVRELFP